MRVRIGALIELVFVVAIGFGYFHYRDSATTYFRLSQPLVVSFQVGDLAQGMAFGLGLCVLTELGCKRSRIQMGVGRIGCTAYTVGLLVALIRISVGWCVDNFQNGTLWDPSSLGSYWANSFFQEAGYFATFVPGLFFVFWMSRRDERIAPDFKEWVGCVLLLLLWMQSATWRLMVSVFPEIQ